MMYLKRHQNIDSPGNHGLSEHSRVASSTSLPLNRLKAQLYSRGEYSSQMREAVIKKFLWEAWFSLACGRKAAFKGDINYAIGSVFKTVCSWVQVLYALNNRYLMNEKGALRCVDGFEIKPMDMEVRIKSMYRSLTDGDAEKAYQLIRWYA